MQACFIVLFHVNIKLHSKEANKSNPLLVRQSLPNLSINMSCYTCTNAHNMVNSMASQSDRKWCETTPIWPIIVFHLSVHHFQATTFTISHCGSEQESLYPKSIALVVGIYHFLVFLPYTTLCTLCCCHSQSEQCLIKKSQYCLSCDATDIVGHERCRSP